MVNEMQENFQALRDRFNEENLMAIELGEKAYMRGETIDDNPFEFHSNKSMYGCWRDGFTKHWVIKS